MDNEKTITVRLLWERKAINVRYSDLIFSCNIKKVTSQEKANNKVL